MTSKEPEESSLSAQGSCGTGLPQDLDPLASPDQAVRILQVLLALGEIPGRSDHNRCRGHWGGKREERTEWSPTGQLPDTR